MSLGAKNLYYRSAICCGNLNSYENETCFVPPILPNGSPVDAWIVRYDMTAFHLQPGPVKLCLSFQIDPKTERAYVLNARLDNGSREHMRHPQFRDDAVFVGVDSSHCIFTVESIAPTQRPPARLVRSAIEVMIEKCGHYLAIMDKPGFGDVVVEGVDPVTPAGDRKLETGSFHSRLNDRDVGLEVAHMSRDKRRVTYTFHGEDHTLGLALRYCILHSTKATFCGYCVPHPLEDKIHFDVQVKNGSAHDTLREGLLCLRDCFVHIKLAFKSALQSFRKDLSDQKK
ncbi:RNA polymerase Rpb3/Rpb11 dimerization domain protein [Opisthorchis viverrini]|uniref:RNA polymerase Rpb3/Rpb11 dimerization domain protein n=1 Tax=Opisthorchis viverrini TaxID=6198 RepID=A0A1S8X992_OPIVI|nr:RNA polymerase Rpb3/Rpb11 dimerization domain protein [Opisthorchis viverrini]